MRVSYSSLLNPRLRSLSRATAVLRNLGAAMLLALLVVGPSAAFAQAPADVDIELILAVDVSMSMDPEEQRLQRDGYVSAFRDPNIIKAIKAGPHGRIAVTYIEWAGPANQQQLLPWTLIDGAPTAETFIAELTSKPYSRYRMTSISSALEFANHQFGTGPYRGVRRVIDVSGDGANNSGAPLAPIRDQLVASGVVINGLPIIMRPTMSWSSWDIPNLDRYYANCVIGGAGSFMVPITTREEFASATRQKLLLEISGIMTQPRIIHAQANGPDDGQTGRQPNGKYDCTVVERNFRRW